MRSLLAAGVLPRDAADLVQETLTRAVALPPCERDGGAWLRLLRGIARNVAREHLRRRGIRERYDLGPCAEPDQSEPLHDEASAHHQIHRRQELLSVLRLFGPRGLEATDVAILAAVAEDVPQAEIAQELGLKPQTVRNRLCRLRRRVLDHVGSDPKPP